MSDPDRFIPAPTTPSQVRKRLRRRAVHSFHATLQGQEQRLYLKLYRVRSMKDIFEELLLGKRAGRSYRASQEAATRGISIPVHLGWSSRAVPDRWPARSVLLMIGLPHNQDARTLLDQEMPDARSRARFAVAIGRFLGDAHRRGIVHGDLKLGNVFVRSLSPPEFALIDLDRAHFHEPHDDRIPLGQAIDLRTLLRSIRRHPRRLKMRLLAGWLRARQPSRAARKRLLRRLAWLGAWTVSSPAAPPPTSGS